MGKESLLVIKIGGNVIDDEASLAGFLNLFAALPQKKILVHGGGKLATQMAKELGIPQQMVNGRRITDAATLKIVTMVYAGLINKNIVAGLQAAGCNALGLTGSDGNVIKAHKRINADHDYGFAGDVDMVNAGFIQALLEQDMSLVMAPISHDGKGQLLNTNADTIAQEVAQAASAHYDTQLIYCFEKPGVLRDVDDISSVIPVISHEHFAELLKEKVIFEGMIPKLHNAFQAIERGVGDVTIGEWQQLTSLVAGNAGTKIIQE